MGGKKRAFIDKKRSATFVLVARDSSASSSNPLSTDRVFVRTDNNHDYSVPGFLDSDEERQFNNRDDGSSVFADAYEDVGGGEKERGSGSGLPEEVRREILELGLPDDGYNYLLHLKEIRNEGAGSAYYENPRARLDLVPLDVKAYDATRVRVSSDAVKEEEPGVQTIYTVASKSAPVRVQKVIDPDVTRLLDDSDLSWFGSDVEEDLEEDFILIANQPDGEEEEKAAELQVKKLDADVDVQHGFESDYEVDDEADYSDRQRVRRLLDEQFDEAFKEYMDSDEDEGPAFVDENQEELAAKLNNALKEFHIEGVLDEEQYKAPGELVKVDQESAEVIRKCTEYAQKYLNESEEEQQVLLVSESSDESEVWDCETIVSTYTNSENHPAKIEAPGKTKKRLPPKSIPFPGALGVGKDVISLGGKEMLPVNYLPQRRRIMEGLVREKLGSLEKPGSVEKPKRKVVGEESKEEKKERKAALKNERREARKAKKELKGLYKSETQKAQKVVAVTGPSSIHLM